MTIESNSSLLPIYVQDSKRDARALVKEFSTMSTVNVVLSAGVIFYGVAANFMNPESSTGRVCIFTGFNWAVGTKLLSGLGERIFKQMEKIV